MKLRARIAPYVVGFAILIVLLAVAPQARAQATITVNFNAQEVTLVNPTGVMNGNCTLGEAILAANTNAAVDGCAAGQSGGTDIIMIPAGTYTLNDGAKVTTIFGSKLLGLPDILDAVILQGASAMTTIIERSSAAATPQFAMTEALGGAITINNLTIRNFETPCNVAAGAVMFFTQAVTLNNSIIEDNRSLSSCGGGFGAFGELFNSNAPFSATNTVFRNNTAQDTNAAVLQASGPVTLTNCTFLNNSTGPGNNVNHVITVGGNGPVNITDSFFSGNMNTNGVIRSQGLPNCGPNCGMFPVINIARSYFLNNGGNFEGGVLSAGGQNLTMTIVDSTFANNHSNHGGVLFVGGPTGNVNITNSTFSGNTAGGFGAAIYAQASGGMPSNFPITLNNVTIVNNPTTVFPDGGALMADDDVDFILRNTIIANNGPLCEMRSNNGGQYDSQGHNIFGHTACASFATTDATDQIGTQANSLHALTRGLADNGSTMMAGANLAGVTSPVVIPTAGLLTGSPALNMGDPGTADGISPHCEATDQRGTARPQPLGGVCDVGAFEDPTGMGVPANFDLSVTKTDSPDPVAVGNNLTYTITVSNAGPDLAPATILTDTLPAGVNFVSATPSNAPAGTCMQAGGTVTCNLGIVNSGGSVTVTIVVTPTAAAGATISNTASVAATGIETNAADNTATEMTGVTGINVDLSVTKTDSPDPINLGQGNVTYTITVANGGPAGATNVVLNDTLPMGANFVSAMASQGACPAPVGGVLMCNLGAIANGGMATVTIVVTPTASGTLTNTVTVGATETDSNPGNNSATATTTVNPVADLSVTKTDAPDPVTQGSNITYTITISNAGPSAATGVMATDAVPGNVTFVSAMGSQGTCTLAAGTITCNVGTINSGASATATVIVTATATGTVTNTINVSSAVTDPNNANNSATATTTVNPPTAASDFLISAAPALQTVSPGQTATFVVTLTPVGGSFANAITLSGFIDPPLGPLTFSSASVTPGNMPATSTLTVMVPSGSVVPGWPRTTPPVTPLLLLLCSALTAVMLAWSRIRHAEPALRRRYAVSMALAIVLLMMTLGQAACTTAGNGLKGAYTVTVTATSGSLSHATNVTINVQ